MPAKKGTRRRPPRKTDPLAAFHPTVRDWFRETYGEASPPQREGWPAIAAGNHTLILAPTGTGKTLSAFLWELNELIVKGLAEPLPNAVHILYVSPLKALNNDIERNLQTPLQALKARFEAAGKRFPEIRVAVRTGDTPPAARARMLRKSPHILITTPESLNILLTSLRGRGMFSGVRAVIIDEIHAVAGTKRGAHLALTLERLERHLPQPPQRIGLSATQRPLEEIARFLGGVDDAAADEHTASRFRDVTIVNCGLAKAMVLEIESPVADLGNVGGTVWPAVAELALDHIRKAQTALVFVNNRSQAERMAARINKLAEEELAQPYHGSLARERRFALEGLLKAGKLRALVSTSSLELGIDIGSVDLVLQLQSPKRVAAGLQRVGRAGHTLSAVSRGVFVPTFRDDVVEMAAIVRAMADGDVEPTQVVQNALDVLAQTLVAMVSVDDWTAEELFRLVRRAYPYHRLSRGAFEEVLAMLAGKYPSDIAAELEARITWDRVSDRVTGSRASRMTAVISGGTIPDRGLYTVSLPDRVRIGELDEEFVHESRVGDVFQLGSSTWRIAAVEHDRVIVHPAPGAPARMPFWHGEYAARSFSLSPRVGQLRRDFADAWRWDSAEVPAEGVEAVRGLMERYRCDSAAAESIGSYMAAQRASTKVIPDERTLLIEEFRDETGAVRVILHSVFGGRVNAPWGMALAQRMRESIEGIDVQVQTTDDGIMLRLPNLGMSTPISALMGLSWTEAERRVLDEVGATSLFGARFRMNAARALLLPRGNPRRRMPLWLQRLRALDLLEAVRVLPSFPILVETYREVLQEAFDMPALRQVLESVQEGRIAVKTVRTTAPSPFAASLQFGFVMDWMYGDDTPRAEQRATMLALDRALLDEVMGSTGADDDTLAAIERLVAERQGTAEDRRARTADELAVLLDRAGDLSLVDLQTRSAGISARSVEEPVAALLSSGRVVGVRLPHGAGNEWRYILVETFPRYRAAYPGDAPDLVRRSESGEEQAAASVIPAAFLQPVLTTHAARREILARHIAVTGPITVDSIRSRYGWDADWIRDRLDEWQRAGKLVQGVFYAGRAQTEWCSRRIVETARRRALAAVRKEIQAVELHAFAAFLQRWQHLDPRDRLNGAAGAAQVVRQLYGISRPATAWERDYLPARVESYDATMLAGLTASGETVWMGEGTADDDAPVRPFNRLRFFERGTGSIWIGERETPQLSENARNTLNVLSRSGALFFADLQAETRLGLFAQRESLRELAAAGVVTNDSVEALRELLRLRPLPPTSPESQPEAGRWLPSDFRPSPDRPVVQRRVNIRRLPKWRRPDKGPGAISSWIGRWSLVRTPGTLGDAMDDESRAEAVARQWLARYGIVTRDWWRRERPPVSWRSIYRELRRLEMRGEVRRGYFVRGLGGAQFALPDAVEQLRSMTSDAGAFVVMATSDPANPYSLALEGGERDPLARPRGAGALIVTRAGRVVLSAEARGQRLRVAPDLGDDDIAQAASTFAAHLMSRGRSERRQRDLKVTTINDRPAGASELVTAFVRAGYVRSGNTLRYLAPV